MAFWLRLQRLKMLFLTEGWHIFLPLIPLIKVFYQRLAALIFQPWMTQMGTQIF